MANQASFDVTSGNTIATSWGDSVGQHLLTTETATPSTVFEGKEWVRTDLNELFRYTGSAAERFDGYGVWASYTPTLTGSVSDPTLGNGTLTGRYRYVGGRAVEFWAEFVQGSTTTITAGNGNIALGLPLAIATGAQVSAAMISSIMYDASTGDYWDGKVIAKSSTEMYLAPRVVSGTYSKLSGFTPGAVFTTAAGDTFTIAGTYESTS